MPKIIGNLRDTIQVESRRILFDSGYKELSVRTIAEACGVAVGTIYNYYENKDMIIANIMMTDWELSLQKMRDSCLSADSVESGCAAIFTEIRCFEALYRSVFLEYTGPNEGLGIYGQRHICLRGQLEELIGSLLKRFGYDSDELLPIMAEMILACAKQEEFTERSVRLIVSRFYPKK